MNFKIKLCVFTVIYFLMIITHRIEAQTESTSQASTTASTNNSSSISGNSTRQVCARSGLTCLDCQTLQYCSNANDSQPLFTVTCAAQTSNQNPYCSAQLNQCVNQNTCVQAEVPVLACSQPGRHPDPLDCTQYVQCTEQNGTLVGYPVKCSDSLHYNQRTQNCGSYPCLEMSRYCTVFQAGKIVAYKPFPNIYGKCPAKGAPNGYIPLASCDGQYVFNEHTAKCEPSCTQVGNIPANEDCHAYYSCGQGFLTGYSMVLNKCPVGFGYNPLTQLCDTAHSNCTNIGS